MTHTEQGAIFPAEGGIETGILDFIKQALSKGCFDAVLISAKTPGGDSFAYLLIQDESLLQDALPICPIMPVQGAKALSAIASILGLENEDTMSDEEVKELIGQIADPGGTFYRFSLPSSLLRRKRVS